MRSELSRRYVLDHEKLTYVGAHALLRRNAHSGTVYCLPGVSREDQAWTLSAKGPFTVRDIVGQQVFAVRAHGGLEDTSVPVAAVLRPSSGTPAFPWERLLDCAWPRAASNNLGGVRDHRGDPHLAGASANFGDACEIHRGGGHPSDAPDAGL